MHRVKPVLHKPSKGLQAITANQSEALSEPTLFLLIDR